MLTARARAPALPAVRAAPTVPEWRTELPVLNPGLIPAATRSGAASKRPNRRASRTTIRRRVGAAPDARSTAGAKGWEAFEKIWADSVVFGPLTLQLLVLVMPMVNSSGAVSPAARATASRHPLTTPGRAAGRTR